MMKKISFLVLVLEGLVELFHVSFFGISGWAIDLDYCDIEWFALETEIILSFLDCIQVLHFRLFC